MARRFRFAPLVVSLAPLALAVGCATGLDDTEGLGDAATGADTSVTPDAKADTGAQDAARDTSVPDTATPVDAGEPDAGEPDAGDPDSGTPLSVNCSDQNASAIAAYLAGLPSISDCDTQCPPSAGCCAKNSLTGTKYCSPL